MDALLHRAAGRVPPDTPYVRVEAEDGRIVLKGNVKSFFQKQMAQEAVRRVDGVQQIDNLLQVNWA